MKKTIISLIAGLILTGYNAYGIDFLLSKDIPRFSASEDLPDVNNKLIHIKHTAAPEGDSAAGLRLEIEGKIDGGLISAYRADVDNGGLYVGTLSRHRLTLGTGGTDHMTITPDGNVGIKTHKALQPLHVHGNAFVSDKLGVGVSSPTNNLQVSGSNALFSSDTDNFSVFISKKYDFNVASIIFQENYSGRAQIGLTSDSDFHFQVSADGHTYTDAFFIKRETGHIGIGDPNTAGARVSIIDKDGGTALKADSYEGGYSIVARKDGNGGAVFISKIDEGTGNSLHIIHNGNDPAMVIEDGFGELMVVESSGNVGIGTSAPRGTLDVNGPIYQRGKVLNADYVFDPSYKLESIGEHAEFMWNNKHLKAIPKAVTDENGREIVELGSRYRGVVEELEKAHIYIEKLHGKMEEQDKRMTALEQHLLKMMEADK